MQRWFFLNEDKPKEKKICSSEPIEVDDTEINEKPKREIPFKFEVEIDETVIINPNEYVYISGNCRCLGFWDPLKALRLLKCTERKMNMWTGIIKIPADYDVSYRYFIGIFDEFSEKMIIKFWESHWEPRNVRASADRENSKNDSFGFMDFAFKIERGWLLDTSIIQLNIFNAPFIWNKKMNENHLVSTKISSLKIKTRKIFKNYMCGDEKKEELIEESEIEEMEEETIKQPVDNINHIDGENNVNQSINTIIDNKTEASYISVEVFNAKESQYTIHNQSMFGITCGADDKVVFHINVVKPAEYAYLVEFYVYSTKSVIDEFPFEIGYTYILPHFFEKSQGYVLMPIYCATRHTQIGLINIRYLIINSLKTIDFNLNGSYHKYWDPQWINLDISHRCFGDTFVYNNQIYRENTLHSLKTALCSDIELVEFDIVMTRDLIPCVYHDENIFVSKCQKSEYNIEKDILKTPVYLFTLDELRSLNLYQIDDEDKKLARISCYGNEHLREYRQFSTLTEFFDESPTDIGFLIDIKFPQKQESLIWDENDIPIDINYFCDKIIETICHKAKRRRIILSSFNVDVCTLLRYKQNLFPVILILQATTMLSKNYVLSDPRLKTVKSMVFTSLSLELFGINAFYKDFFEYEDFFRYSSNNGLILFTYGDLDMTNTQTIEKLRELQLNGIVYDKIKFFISKDKRSTALYYPVFHTNKKEYEKFLEINVKMLENKELNNKKCPIEFSENDKIKIIELEAERKNLALSTATSISSLYSDSSENENHETF